LDGVGYALSAATLPSPLLWNGSTFNLGPANAPDAVTSKAVPVTGRFGRLDVLATAVNGNQVNQVFTVKYTDGSESTFAQSISDWYVPQQYPSESIALSVPYRVTSIGSKDVARFNLYGYSFPLADNKTVSSVVLPNNPHVVVLAMTLGAAR
jgi:hypothetical protein